jgi:hypothetical protein
MKKIYVLLISILFVFCANAQVQKKDEIPSSAKTAFAAKFPKAQKVKWSIEKPGEYEAEFVTNRTESSAVFDGKGNFIESETEIKSSELPQLVKSSIEKSFAGYKLDEVEKATDAKGVVSYEMEAVKGSDKLEISFDANGKLLKKEPLKKEDKEKKD